MWSLEAARSVIWIIVSLWDSTGASAAVLPRRRSNLRAIEKNLNTSLAVSRFCEIYGPLVNLFITHSLVCCDRLGLFLQHHVAAGQTFCEARRASHCHSLQTTYSSKSTCCAISAQNSAMHVVVYAGRLTSQRSIVEIINWWWSYWQI